MKKLYIVLFIILSLFGCDVIDENDCVLMRIPRTETTRGNYVDRDVCVNPESVEYFESIGWVLL